MTTRLFIFLGDSLELNADASAGSITVTALGADGGPISRFSPDSSTAITTDDVHHVLRWRDHKDLHQLQGRAIRLKFHITNAKLYSLTPRTRHTHYVPSYD